MPCTAPTPRSRRHSRSPSSSARTRSTRGRPECPPMGECGGQLGAPADGETRDADRRVLPCLARHAPAGDRGRVRDRAGRAGAVPPLGGPGRGDRRFPLHDLPAPVPRGGLGAAGALPRRLHAGGARHATRAPVARAPASVLGDRGGGSHAPAHRRPARARAQRALRLARAPLEPAHRPALPRHHQHERPRLRAHPSRPCGDLAEPPGRVRDRALRPPRRAKGGSTVKSRVPLAVSIPQTFPSGPVDADRIRRYLARAEALGFTGAWAVEQITGTIPSLEPVELLTFAAATTTRLRLGAAVLLTALRSPLHTAKSL